MEDSARYYICPKCLQSVVLCNHCDRGNIYCFSGCSEIVRRESLQESGKRYQNSQKGRRNHAQRQAEYRIRQALAEVSSPPASQSATHHGSGETPPTASIEADEQKCELTGFKLPYRCHCCGRVVSSYLRRSYLRHNGYSHPGSSSFQTKA